MQDPVNSVMQPFVKLTQANTALLQRFVTSPEVMTESMTSAQALIRQAQESTLKLAQSNAFASMVQGLMKNYTEFMLELGQSGMAALSQGQSGATRQALDATSNFISAAESRSRRG